MHPLLAKRAFLCDMDGVIYHGNRLLAGVPRFVAWLQETRRPFLFLTNSSERSPRELAQKLARMGIAVDEGHFYTSALATASFLASQKPNGSAYVIGESGLANALYDVGYTMNDVDPDYVVVGETRSYHYEQITKAMRLVLGGARLIGTNPDVTGPTDTGLVPACGSLCAPIELATGRKAYFVGKPNPVMMRTAVKRLGAAPEDAAIIGDRMDTDIIAGIESGLDTALVLSGVATRDDLARFPWRPNHVLTGIDELAASIDAG